METMTLCMGLVVKMKQKWNLKIIASIIFNRNFFLPAGNVGERISRTQVVNDFDRGGKI